MGIPYELVDLAIVLAVAGLVFVFRQAPGREIEMAQRRQNAAISRPDWVRPACLGLVAIVFSAAFILRAAGAPLLPADQPLVFGHAWGGDDPLLLSVGSDQMVYAYAPDATFRVGITLANSGHAPLTVTGLDPSSSSFVRSLEFRLPPGELTADLQAVNPGISTTWTSEPFRPFDIPPQSEVGIGLQVGLVVCPGLTAVPTLGPGATLPITSPDLGAGFTAVQSLDVRYTVLGVVRTAVVPLPEVLDVATNSRQPIDCQPG